VFKCIVKDSYPASYLSFSQLSEGGHGSTWPHQTFSPQLCLTSSSTFSIASILNNAVVSKYGKVLIWKTIWFWHKEEELNGR